MLRLHPEIEEALGSGRAVVALESTVIAHGLPGPLNLEVGAALEREVREAGAVPATVAVLGGTPHVGLEAAEMERLTAPGVLKLSTRDLPVAAARAADGATTVAATAWLAARAGIHVFATGGIGGVHRGDTNDVSADITELGRTSIIVVCAGAKSILDLPATRETLETAGVLVIGWRADEMPAFYSVSSGLPVDARVDTGSEVAELWRMHRRLGVPGAILVTVPPPPEAALPEAEVGKAIAAALATAQEKRIAGKEITPFLLADVARRTGGRSLQANVALLRRNAGVAGAIARAITAR